MYIYSQNNMNFKAGFKYGDIAQEGGIYAKNRLAGIAKAIEQRTANSFPKGDFGFYKLNDKQYWFYYSKQDKNLYHNGCIGTFSKEGLDNLFKLKDNEIVEKLNEIIIADRQIQYRYTKDMYDICNKKASYNDKFAYVLKRARANMDTILDKRDSVYRDFVFAG